jgi:regulation of enolase protein 1 (concanavalin A-like superfamily)
MTTFTLPGIPGEFHWLISPVEWSFEPARGLSILAGAQTDWFSDPSGDYSADSAPCALVTPPDDNFILSARVSVTFAFAYDAGVLQVRAADNLWAKLCFEYSPQNRPMIVSVVTRGVSDDCNSAEIDSSEVYLRVARTPTTLAFHYSHDGHVWQFVRYFTLGTTGPLKVGFSAQSPTGTKCAAVFSEMDYRRGCLKDIRSGE